MIFDVLDKLEFYSDMVKELKEVGRVLDWNIYDNKEGSYTTDDPKVTYEIVSYDTTDEEVFFEINKKYITVEILLEGSELTSYSHRDLVNQIESYDSKTDKAFVKGEVVGVVNLVPGRFVLYFPDEPHKSKVNAYEKNHVKKIIFKIDYE